MDSDTLYILVYTCLYSESRNNAVGIATPCYGTGQLRGRSSSPVRTKNFLLVVHAGAGAYPVSCSKDTQGLFPGVNGREARHSPTGAEVKIYISITPYAVMVYCLISYRDNCTDVQPG
jgi:hypothetical protein